MRSGMTILYLEKTETCVKKNLLKENSEFHFRFMGTGKHIGKVLIKIRPEEPDITTPPTTLLKEAIPRFSCDAGKVYIIVGEFCKTIL